ncbi:MAG: sulfatase-like hydrolase/transferase [Candidatus Aminicenantes bacterium]|nr:sulfatase-like hydrolase/transferase [Candidatus Aminicenantes bacterium]
MLRSCLKSLAIFIVAVVFGLFPPITKASPADTNVLLITIDTLRPDRLSCYSSKYVQTPRIDALAARGVLFERAFAHDPITLPSHTNILLGLTSLVHGVNENVKSVVSKEFVTLAEALKKKGYATGAFVSAFPLDSQFGLNRGFDVYDDHYPSQLGPGLDYAERKAEKTIAAALAWLSLQKGKWFCWVHLWDPHAPYSPPEPYAGQFSRDPYSGEVAYVDAELGKLLDTVDKKGWRGKTLIILTGDHGESLGEHGEQTHSYFAYNSTIWVPLIISGPGLKASRVKADVSHVDIFPTVCDILGIGKPAALEGNSLEPFLNGKARKAATIYFEALEANLSNGWAPLRGIIEEGKKYIDSPIPELYDLEKDFEERTNIAEQADLGRYKKRLAEVEKAATSKPGSQGVRKIDRETRDKLRTLGYVVAPVAQSQKSYGREDDLKRLLPLMQKLEQAAQLEQQGKPAESAQLLEDVIQARKDFATAYDHLFRVYRSQGQTEKALRVLERGVGANPGKYGFVSGYGIALVKEGRFKQGAEVLERALGLFDQDAEAWNSLGVAYWKQGNLEKALKYFEKALALDPNDAIYNDNIGGLYVVMSLKAKNPDELQRALEYFKTSIARDPTLASAYNGLAGAYSLMGKKAEAIANWEKAVELDSKYDYPVYNLALAYLDRGDKTRALEYCQRYLTLKGSNMSAQERQEIESLIQRCKK